MVFLTASPDSTAPRHARVGALFVGLWLLAWLFGPFLASAVGVDLNLHGHAQLHEHGHPFIDARTRWGVPNAMDVLSNLPLALAGLCGLWVLLCHRVDAAARPALAFFFAGLLLAALGSAWYHWAPDAVGLALDRLGMAVTFAGALALALDERVGPRSAAMALRAVLPMALVSAVLPLAQDNPWPWVVVQFGGMAWLAVAALQPPRPGALGVRLGVLIAIYALAKLFELGDEAVFQATGQTVSGHSLKHAVAALAAWPVLGALRQNPRAKGGTAAPLVQ